jgi:hypothetical protein
MAAVRQAPDDEVKAALPRVSRGQHLAVAEDSRELSRRCHQMRHDPRPQRCG